MIEKKESKKTCSRLSSREEIINHTTSHFMVQKQHNGIMLSELYEIHQNWVSMQLYQRWGFLKLFPHLVEAAQYYAAQTIIE